MYQICIKPLHLLDFCVSIPIQQIYVYICPHLSRLRKCNANLELQIYHIFGPFANISKSVFSSSVEYLRKEGWNADWPIVIHTQSVSSHIDRTDSTSFPTRRKFPSIDTQIDYLCQGRHYSRINTFRSLFKASDTFWRFSSFDKDGWQSSKLSVSLRLFSWLIMLWEHLNRYNKSSCMQLSSTDWPSCMIL